MPVSTVSPELAGRIEVVHRLGEWLAAHRGELIEAAGKDTGTLARG